MAFSKATKLLSLSFYRTIQHLRKGAARIMTCKERNNMISTTALLLNSVQRGHDSSSQEGSSEDDGMQGDEEGSVALLAFGAGDCLSAPSKQMCTKFFLALNPKFSPYESASAYTTLPEEEVCELHLSPSILTNISLLTDTALTSDWRDSPHSHTNTLHAHKPSLSHKHPVCSQVPALAQRTLILWTGVTAQ